jgi:hypothetical protein
MLNVCSAFCQAGLLPGRKLHALLHCLGTIQPGYPGCWINGCCLFNLLTTKNARQTKSLVSVVVSSGQWHYVGHSVGFLHYTAGYPITHTNGGLRVKLWVPELVRTLNRKFRSESERLGKCTPRYPVDRDNKDVA